MYLNTMLKIEKKLLMPMLFYKIGLFKSGVKNRYFYLKKYKFHCTFVHQKSLKFKIYPKMCIEILPITEFKYPRSFL